MPKQKTTIDDLAVMMKKGFDGVDEQFSGLKQGVNAQFSRMDERLDKLKTGQEDIKLRLDQAAWRFEMRDLEKRVKVLEDHTGIQPAKTRH